MDKQRHTLSSYEYLCHVGEAQQWIEGCIDEETGFGVTEMEEGLRDGVVLAKLARVFQGDQVVKKIWTVRRPFSMQSASADEYREQDSKHRYKQVDNIDHFMRFLRTVGMPTVSDYEPRLWLIIFKTFMFDPIDLYDKKNIPKVIFCIHVLRSVTHIDEFGRETYPVQSHLLSRQGLAERIGDLVGQFDFTGEQTFPEATAHLLYLDEQLAKTQKGIQGVAMPNFGDVRKTLAKEASWEPEEPMETEAERMFLTNCLAVPADFGPGRDRELLACEPSTLKFQCLLRGKLARARLNRITYQLDLAKPVVVRLQARARGAMSRAALMAQREEEEELYDWATDLQAMALRRLSMIRLEQQYCQLSRAATSIIGIQAHARAELAKSQRAITQRTLHNSTQTITGLQAACRGCIGRRTRTDIHAQVSKAQSIVPLQAICRGHLIRQRDGRLLDVLDSLVDLHIGVQSHVRGALLRRKHRAREKHLDDASSYIVAIQSTARGVLARRKKQKYVQQVQQAYACTVFPSSGCPSTTSETIPSIYAKGPVQSRAGG